MNHLSHDRPHDPATFIERGASVPFTTPMLAAARVRQAPRRGLDLLVPNPSGGRGTYILPWTNMRALCRPTVHDCKLLERIVGLEAITPATVREAARHVAAQGFAGRAAASAAAAALAYEQENAVVTNFQLLLRLVQQEEPPGSPQTSAGLQPRAKRIVATVAPRIGQTPAIIATTLEHLAVVYEPIGLADGPNPARLPQTIAMVKRFRQEALATTTDADEHAAALIAGVLVAADVTISGAEAAVGDARAAAGQMTRLLVDWRVDANAVTRRLTRAEWLLDGWERACQLWSLDPRPAARCAAMDEIAGLLPVIPREASDWPGIGDGTQRLMQIRRLVPGHQDWRTGQCVQDTIARNEALLAA